MIGGRLLALLTIVVLPCCAAIFVIAKDAWRRRQLQRNLDRLRMIFARNGNPEAAQKVAEVESLLRKDGRL